MLTDSKNFPHISLILPFSPEMIKQPGLLRLLVISADKAEQDLMKNYSKEETTTVMEKLRHLIQNIKCSKDEKTLAIFVSPSSEKIYYYTPSNATGHYLPVLVSKK